jgi:FKBP-type peptidyl-prolyl cis-trans isomerase 2
MNHRKLRKDAKANTNVLFIILIVVLLLSASSVVILLSIGQNTASARKVVNGDNIKVNYVGKLADGRVFDTSFYSVASNDALYPKSLSFGLRANTTYVPLQFTVGSGNLIKGFEAGVIGMSLNQTKVIAIPPSLGYGLMNLSRLSTFTLTDSAPVFVTMNLTVFQQTYNVTPEARLTVTDPVWGWFAQVIQVNANADQVEVQNMPIVGDRLAVYGTPSASVPTGWYADVVSIDSTANGGAGVIVIQHLLTASDAGKVQGADIRGNFIVDQIDPATGIARKNYNDELVGVTIYFTVTLYSFVSNPI